MPNSNAYMAAYMRERYHARRAKIIERLGGCCSACGSTERLEIDHADASKKAADIARIWSYSDARLSAELSKCQILCFDCHRRKTLRERGLQDARAVHGTLSSYRYCKCDVCRSAKAEYMRRYRAA